MWLQTDYEKPIAVVEGGERKVNRHLQKQFAIPKRLIAAVYVRSGQLQLPLSSMEEDFKVAQ